MVITRIRVSNLMTLIHASYIPSPVRLGRFLSVVVLLEVRFSLRLARAEVSVDAWEDDLESLTIDVNVLTFKSTTHVDT